MQRSPKELRNFGLVVGGVFLVLGAWLLYRAAWGSPTGAVFVILATGLILLGAAVPRILAPAYAVWMLLARVLGWINTRLILGIVFYGLFTPTRLLLAAFGKDLMKGRPAPDLATYWIDVSGETFEAESMEHPF